MHAIAESREVKYDGDTSVPPKFTYEESCELMEPIGYRGIHGITYKIEERLKSKDTL